MNWSDIPTAGKMTVYTVGVLVAVATFAFETFQTISAAEQQQQTLVTETRAGRIDEIRRNIDDKRYQLLATDLNPNQRNHLEAKIRELESKIACIQSGRSNC